jgi:hypothetical protein
MYYNLFRDTMCYIFNYKSVFIIHVWLVALYRVPHVQCPSMTQPVPIMCIISQLISNPPCGTSHFVSFKMWVSADDGSRATLRYSGQCKLYRRNTDRTRLVTAIPQTSQRQYISLYINVGLFPQGNNFLLAAQMTETQ